MANQPQPERPLLAQFILVVASLLCGTGVWLVVQLTETQERTLSLAVRPMNVPPEVILSVKPAEVPVKFSFPATERNRMVPQNFAVEIDFSDVRERLGRKFEDAGDRTLSRDMVKPRDPRVALLELNISPVELITPQVQWEARVLSARGVLEATVKGKPEEGYTVDARKAQIEGDREIIVLLTPQKEAELRAAGQDFVTVPLEPVDITGRRGVVSQQVALRLPEGVSLPSDDEKGRTRNVVIEVAEQTITRVLEDVPVRYQFIGSGDGLVAVVDPPAVDVEVTGPISAANALTPRDITFRLFYVEESAGISSQVAVEADIANKDLRRAIQNIETRPRSVTVSFEESDQDPAPPSDPPTPAPTPAPTPVLSLRMEGGTPEQREALAALLGGLPAGYAVEAEAAVPESGALSFRVTTHEPADALADLLLAAAPRLPFRFDRELTDAGLVLRIAPPPAPPAPGT